MEERHGLWCMRSSWGILAGPILALASVMFMAGCGSPTSQNNVPLPVVTVSPNSTSVPAGLSQQFTATVVTSIPTTLTWAVNNIQGGNSIVGTITDSGYYMAPATVPSPDTITVKAISSAESNPFGAALVKITPPPTKVVVSVSPTVSEVAAGSTLQFSSGVTGTSNTAVEWSVNGITGGNPTVGTVTTTGFYAAPLSLPNPATVTVTATSVAQSSASGSGSVTISNPSAAVRLSPASTSVWAASTVQFVASAPGIHNPVFKWSVNGNLGGDPNVGTICNSGVAGCTSPGLYTSPVFAPNPNSITVSVAVQSGDDPPGDTFLGSAAITIAPPQVEGISPIDPSVMMGTTVQLAANVIPANSADIKWAVNGVIGGNSTVGTVCNPGDSGCSTPGVYTPPAALPTGGTVALTVMGQTDTTNSASTPLMLVSSNTAPLYVNFGANGNTGNPRTTNFNGLYTTISVCLANTPQCQIIPNILVDTGSVGLRLLNTTLTSVPANAFGSVKDSAGNQLQECVQFPDTSYAWGPVLIGDVVVGGERAGAVPFQLLGGTAFPVPFANCLSLGTGPNLNSVAVLGANGILGIGTSIQDCGLNCAAGQTFDAYPYYVCPLNVCQRVAVPVAQQVANPVALFAKDNNGLQIALPSIPDTGAPSLPFVNSDGSGLISAGQIVFGVGTESNNALGSATLFPLDANRRIPKLVYNGTSYVSEGFPNSRSNALRILSAPGLGVLGCPDNSYYCPSSTSQVSIVACAANADAQPGSPCGAGVASETLSLNIANADLLFSDNPDFSAFSNLGAESLTTTAVDQFDLGLPFFYGRTIFVGIAGTSIPNNADAPNGYVAF